MMHKLTFEQWKQQVDKILIQKCGMPADCLPDYPYFDCWKAGDLPEETAEDAIDNAKDY